VGPGAPFGVKRFEAAKPLGTPAPWRRLIVVVTEERVTASWEPAVGGQVERIADVSRQTLESYLREQLCVNPDLKNVRPGFAPPLGLGLYVWGGEASFRSIVLEPSGNGD
jgi:hypothetical protein